MNKPPALHNSPALRQAAGAGGVRQRQALAGGGATTRHPTTPLDKRLSLPALAAKVESGMTVGIGGWGARRKPMAFIRQLLNTDVKDLTVVSFGGPDVGLLAATGKISKLIFGFVSLDLIPLEAHFRKARQSGAFAVMELDEGMLQLGLKAAAARLPFLPTRAGLASDVLATNPEIQTLKAPYTGETLVAMPALPLDLAVCHVNQADKQGNSRIASPDPFFDEWFCRAAETAYLTTEEVVETAAFSDPITALQMPIERSLIAGVAQAPYGAHPTACAPNYGWDLAHLREYNATAKEGFPAYLATYITNKSQADYVKEVGGPKAINSLPLPVF